MYGKDYLVEGEIIKGNTPEKTLSEGSPATQTLATQRTEAGQKPTPISEEPDSIIPQSTTPVKSPTGLPDSYSEAGQKFAERLPRRRWREFLIATVFITVLLGVVAGWQNEHQQELEKKAPQDVADPWKAEAIEKVKAAAKYFSSVSGTNITTLESAYKVLRKELDAASVWGEITEVSKFKHALAATDTLYSRLLEIDNLDANTELPDIPEKPVYEQPEYDGAWYLRGKYVGHLLRESGFRVGGVILSSNGKYYILSDDLGGEPTVRYGNYIEAYVISLKVTEYLNTGPSAEHILFANREAYQRNKRLYQEKIAEAKADYKEALKEYNDAVARQRKGEAEIARSRARRAKERSALLARKPEVLTTAAIAVASIVGEYSPKQQGKTRNRG